MRFILWHVESGSEVVGGEERLLVNLKTLIYLINSFFSHASEMQVSEESWLNIHPLQFTSAALKIHLLDNNQFKS